MLLEGLCAGSGVKRYLGELEWPSFSPPLWAWYTIGVVYYVVVFVCAYRVLQHPATASFRSAALTLLLVIVAPKRLLERAFFSGKKPPGHFRIFDGLFSYRNRLLVLSQSIRPSRGVRFRFLSDLFDLRERFGIPSLATKQRRAVTVFPVFPCLKKPLVTGGASDGESQFHARWLT